MGFLTEPRAELKKRVQPVVMEKYAYSCYNSAVLTVIWLCCQVES